MLKNHLIAFSHPRFWLCKNQAQPTTWPITYKCENVTVSINLNQYLRWKLRGKKVLFSYKNISQKSIKPMRGFRNGPLKSSCMFRQLSHTKKSAFDGQLPRAIKKIINKQLFRWIKFRQVCRGQKKCERVIWKNPGLAKHKTTHCVKNFDYQKMCVIKSFNCSDVSIGEKKTHDWLQTSKSVKVALTKKCSPQLWLHAKCYNW